MDISSWKNAMIYLVYDITKINETMYKIGNNTTVEFTKNTDEKMQVVINKLVSILPKDYDHISNKGIKREYIFTIENSTKKNSYFNVEYSLKTIDPALRKAKIKNGISMAFHKSYYPTLLRNKVLGLDN